MLGNVIERVSTITDAIAVMRAIDAALPDADGVKWFNYLYLKVTEAVRADAASWEDWAFLERFDVAFARLYFDAVTSWERTPASTPRAWRPLFTARHEPGRSRIQFALAGMNAHINHDLAIALDALATSSGGFPPRTGARFNDFRRVNDLLEQMEARLRAELVTGLAGEIDRALGDVDNVLMMWKVRQARDAAWTNGELLWHLRDNPPLRQNHLTQLDHMVGFAGRGLLVPRLGGSSRIAS